MEDILNSFQKSIERLDEILKDEKTLKTRDAAIQRFEFTSELSWKCIQKFLREQGIICRSPKECLREAFKFGLVEDDERWISILQDRNLTTHTYDEKVAEDVYDRLPGYLEIFQKLFILLQEKLIKE